MSKRKIRERGVVFRFKDYHGGIIPMHVKVRYATMPANVTVTEDDVIKSISLHGVGNCQTCTMACSVRRQPEQFNHPIAGNGFVEWTKNRAYVVSKVSKDGQLLECVCYQHNDNIADLNDTAGGQRKLLKQIQEKGPRVVRLYPTKPERPREKGRPRGKNTGERSTPTRSLRAKGAKRRFIFAQQGGIPVK